MRSCTDQVQGISGGVIYLDDGVTFANKDGNYIYRAITVNSNLEEMKTTTLHFGPNTEDAYAQSIKYLRIEKIIIVGAKDEWVQRKSVTVHVGGDRWDVQVEGSKGKKGKPNVVVIRDPKLPVALDWSVRFDAEQQQEKQAEHSEL